MKPRVCLLLNPKLSHAPCRTLEMLSPRIMPSTIAPAIAHPGHQLMPLAIAAATLPTVLPSPAAFTDRRVDVAYED